MTAGTDISIAREHRARGLGTEALWLACEMLGASGKAARIVARIKSENVASLRAFQKAGFVFQGKGMFQGKETIFMSREVKGR